MPNVKYSINFSHTVALFCQALMRPGRLDRIIYVPLPDKVTRREIFDIHFKKTPIAEDVCADDLVVETEGYSGAEVNM